MHRYLQTMQQCTWILGIYSTSTIATFPHQCHCYSSLTNNIHHLEPSVWIMGVRQRSNEDLRFILAWLWRCIGAIKISMIWHSWNLILVDMPRCSRIAPQHDQHWLHWSHSGLVKSYRFNVFYHDIIVTSRHHRFQTTQLCWRVCSG